MPELPELHVFSRNLRISLGGRTVQKVVLWHTRRLNFSKEKIEKSLKWHTLQTVRREGKEIHFHFDSGNVLAVHLMLAGQFELTRNPRSIRYAQFGFEVDNGEWLIISDPRGLATFTLDPKPNAVPDALADECSAAYLENHLSRCIDLPLKSFLIDQTILRGIGNAYADEILWHCRIAPQSFCNRLPKGKANDLHEAIQSVLKDAIAQIESRSPDAINGEIRDFLRIHRPDQTLCPAGHPIRCEMVGMKKTYYSAAQITY